MFQFPGFAPSHDGTWPSAMWVAPFGHSRINSCFQIPATFRSLPRPSSPPDSLGILRSLFVPFSNESRFTCLPAFRLTARPSIFFALAYEIAVPNFNEKTHLLLQTISFYLCFYLLIFSLSIVNEPCPKPHFWMLVSNGTAKVAIIFYPPNFF